MNLSNEQAVEYIKFDLEQTDDEYAMLRQMGLDIIAGDPQALINYAIIKVLEDHLEILATEVQRGQKIQQKGDANGRTS